MNLVLPWTRPCGRCRRPISAQSPYFERGVGPRCGGVIRHARAPARPPDVPAHRACPQLPGQLDLLAELEVTP